MIVSLVHKHPIYLFINKTLIYMAEFKYVTYDLNFS